MAQSTPLTRCWLNSQSLTILGVTSRWQDTHSDVVATDALSSVRHPLTAARASTTHPHVRSRRKAPGLRRSLRPRLEKMTRVTRGVFGKSVLMRSCPYWLCCSSLERVASRGTAFRCRGMRTSAVQLRLPVTEVVNSRLRQVSVSCRESRGGAGECAGRLPVSTRGVLPGTADDSQFARIYREPLLSI